jgi:DNA-directed RNA polymerase II subunit RPB2
MEIARHVFSTYFKDTTNPLVRHHLDSFSDLLTTKIPNFIKGSNPQRLVADENRTIDVYIGGKDGNKISYKPPVEETDEVTTTVLPHTCRLENKTYSLSIIVDIDIEYIVSGKTITKSFENVLLGRIPLMLKSSLCALASMTPEQLKESGECSFELGGYFIINGAEKVLLTQERLGDNIPYATKRVQQPAQKEERGLVEKESAAVIEGATKAEKFEYISGIRSISEDGTVGPYSHFLMIPPANIKPDDPELIEKSDDYGSFSTKRLATITLPGFTQPVPLFSVFAALGLGTDADIYDTILAGVPPSERPQYDQIFYELRLSHDKYLEIETANEEDFTQDADLFELRRQTRTRSNGAVFVNIFTSMFPHCEKREGESTASLYRRKAYVLGNMVRMAMDVAIGKTGKSDRDHFRFKRLDSSGDLCFQLFRKTYKETGKEMLTKIDSRIHFEQQTYSGERIVNVVQPENMSYYWNSRTLLNQFEKSFKGKWDNKDGISQELSRLAYLGTIAHLRRVNLQMDKTTKVVEPRRIHASTWGIMCPADNPDGGNIGMIKSMTLFCALSTASRISDVVKLLQSRKEFTPIHLIHPSTWKSQWTKVFLNSDLVGVFESHTETIHSFMLSKRREGTLQHFVSLCWNRMNNEYIIFTDSGRPSRPIYREKTRSEDIQKAKTWDKLLDNIDYVDAQETESLRISMEPFSSKHPSEIHGSVIFSASAAVIPNSDFNQAPRNFFSCQQTKQACSWFSTAFSKRFDTIATLLNYAQRPLSQTWMYNSILGSNGCLPYGENAIVALAIYGGYNQEDSILLNDSALRRGMFHTTYYHSYDVLEEMIDPATRTHTEFANTLTDPKYREIVQRKKEYNYELLDNDGIIRKGVHINDETVLVSIVSPSTDAGGQVRGYNDSSYTPKRGQHGVIDDVYRYITPDGLRGVKIRVAEHRLPVLGDKYSARHGQKGTVGFRIPEEDMPFTSKGLRPDMIVNPHAFPSRMTIGQFVESMATKLGVHMGALIDSTPFTTQNRVVEVRKLLDKAGYHPYGHEILYNGHTGEMMPVEIFMGPTYYLRLKHMVEDKINYTTRGPRKLLTHQPVEGRSNEGGLRVGEMERDSLISHGASKFLHESLMDRSDGAEVSFDAENGVLDARPEIKTKLNIPYSLNVFTKELESMHISMKYIS